MRLTTDKIRRYFESRLPDANFRKPGENMVRCPFHQDSTASLSVNLEKGTFNCFGCNVNGGYLAFEMKFSSCDEGTAWANIADIAGEKQAYVPGQKPEATYQYHDARGNVVFEKLRYPGKRFSQRRPDGKGGWIYKLDGVTRKPLYNLPSVLVSNEILIAEGEKDADNAAKALKEIAEPTASTERKAEPNISIAGTTNFDGAGKWKETESVYFAGKRVVVLADNDEVGRKHAETVAASVYPYALGVKVIQFPELPEHGDVSDFLKSHSPAELVERIKKTPQWRPTQTERRLLVPALVFANREHEEIDWLVEGFIQRKANGFFVAEPKAGKSFAAIDLAVSLSMGVDWLGMKIPRPVRVALISREDTPALTAWRIGHLLRGKDSPQSLSLADENLWVNTRDQSPQYQLDNEEQYQEMLKELCAVKPDLAIFDVLNRLHGADENDNQEMCAILQKFTEIQEKAGCSIAVVHHFNKAQSGTLINKMRGSSAIAGWAEWVAGISLVDQESGVRRMDFETKVAESPAPIHYRIIAPSSAGVARLERTDWSGQHQNSAGSVTRLMRQQ